MPTFDFTSPEGKSYSVQGPDGATSEQAFQILQSQIGGAPAAPDIGTGRAGLAVAARGIPVGGAYTDKAIAAFNAAAQPLVETGLSHKGSYSERLAENEAMVKAAADAREREHPIESTLEKVGLGSAALAPAMMAAPAATGLAGTLGTMATRGALFNAGVGGVDAAARGEDIGKAALEGGLVGAALPVVARGAGKAIQAVKDWRNPPPVVPSNVETVGGVDIPFHTTADPAIEARKEIMRKGAAGSEAEQIALAADEAAKKSIGQATESITNPKGLPPASASDAGVAVQSELAAQEATRQAAETAQGLQVDAQGRSLARDLGGGAAPVSPFDAAEGTGAAVTKARDVAAAKTQAAYEARDAVPGAYDPSVANNLTENLRARLNTGPDQLNVGPETEHIANRALALLDRTVGKDSGIFANAAAPKPAPSDPAAASDDVGATVAALRAKFGDGLADAYANQSAKKTNPQSLLQFIASKGGVRPDQELNAIGLGPGHRVQIPGQPGFFSAVKKNGMELDLMREAAEEAGYFRGHGEATSTPTEFLDAIDAELRGQKRYPEGFEGHKTAGEKTAMGAREQHEHDALHRDLEDDLAAAGHGGLGPDVKERAVQLMRDEGMHPDDAVDHAIMQLDQEDMARGAPHAPSDFPGDRAAAPKPGADRPIDLKTMDEARKQLGSMFRDAKEKAIAGQGGSDLRAMSKILHEFDNEIADALASGKFSGDAALAAKLQKEARAAHAEYRQTFSSRGPGDEIGRAVEKILGRYSDTAATAEDIQKLSYGPKGNPGTGMSSKVAGRLQQILGKDSAGYARWKQGLFHYVDDRSLPVLERAQRIDEFLGTSGARVALDPEEKAAMAAYSKSLRATAPSKEPLSNLQKDVARISGADGGRPATVDEVTKMLTEKTGNSQRLLVHLKQNLTSEGWDKVRRGVLDHVLNAPEGHNEFTALAKSKRLSDFLASGKADLLLTGEEKRELGKLAGLHKRLVPIPGTTNPSGSAWVGARLLKKAVTNFGAMIGLAATHGSLTGAAVGHGLDYLGSALKDARAGKEAVRLFYGPQAKSAMPRIPRLPVAIAQSAIPASQR